MSTFWNTQPMVNYSSSLVFGKSIEEKTIEDIQTEPYLLPNDLYWKVVDINDDREMDELYHLIHNNYVGNGSFRLEYTKDFLKWALRPPNYIKEWHISIRIKRDGKDVMVGFISAIPMNIIYKRLMKTCEINFLCCHKKMRDQGMAPLLIKEITRRVNLLDIWQAIYTAGVKLPTPFSKSIYYHRALNLRKLINIEFMDRPYNKLTMKSIDRLYKVQNNIVDMRPMTIKDVKQVTIKLNNYLSKFKLHIVFSEEEVKYWFINDYVKAFVVEKNGDISDFCSFYMKKSTIVNNSEYDFINIAYVYYYFTGNYSVKELINSILFFAKENNNDVVNITDIMDNNEAIDDNVLKFSKGNGSLNYYLYNMNIEKIKPSNVALTMI